MADDRGVAPVSLELTTDELALVRAALELLLDAEEDTETIEELKDLIGRLQRIG